MVSFALQSMRIFPFRRKTTLSKLWTYHTEGVLWRVLHSSLGIIVGEKRNEKKKEAGFFAIDARTGKVLWDISVAEAPWWIGIEAVERETLLLHQFAQPDRPEHKGIFAYDVPTGMKRWQQQDLTYWFHRADSVMAIRQYYERRVCVELNMLTGDVTEEFEDFNSLSELRRDSSTVQQGFQFPIPFDVEHSDQDVVAAVRENVSLQRIPDSLEYAQQDGIVILDYYVRKGSFDDKMPRLENHLDVVHLRSGDRIYSDIINRESKVPVPDSFFVKDQFLFYVKDNTELIAVKLPEEPTVGANSLKSL
jgi:hypothetical protein